ncbi:hypothetical protein GEMRC1_010977 [Eukaryota sp. GEM-RC1]
MDGDFITVEPKRDHLSLLHTSRGSKNPRGRRSNIHTSISVVSKHKQQPKESCERPHHQKPTPKTAPLAVPTPLVQSPVSQQLPEPSPCHSTAENPISDCASTVTPPKIPQANPNKSWASLFQPATTSSSMESPTESSSEPISEPSTATSSTATPSSLDDLKLFLDSFVSSPALVPFAPCKGFPNPNLTLCYINGPLQAIFSSDWFVSCFLNILKYFESLDSSHVTLVNTLSLFSKVYFDQLTTGKDYVNFPSLSRRHQSNSINTGCFAGKINLGSTRKQHDAHEFLIFLLHELHDEFLKIYPLKIR